MCTSHCWSKERVPFKVLCVWERGNALSHSADGKLLLLWLSPNLHILPSSILPLFSPSLPPLEKQNSGGGAERESKSERETDPQSSKGNLWGKKEGEEKKNLVPSCLQPPGLHKPPKDSGTQRRTPLTAKVPPSHRLLVFNSIPLKKRKKDGRIERKRKKEERNGTHLRGKEDETGSSKAETGGNVMRRGTKTQKNQRNK